MIVTPATIVAYATPGAVFRGLPGGGSRSPFTPSQTTAPPVTAIAPIATHAIGTLRAMNLLGTHHVAVICSDYARSKWFYVEILGLEVVAETHRAARGSYKLDLRLPDGTQVELFSFPDPPPRPSYPEACGLRLLAFAVADLDAAVAHLGRHGVGVEPVRADALTGKRFTFFADPDGLPLELYER